MLTKDQVIAALDAALPAHEAPREGVPVVLPTEVVIAAAALLNGRGV